MRKAEHMTTPAFPEPNHTQTPNNFFEMVADMSDAELRVTIIMIRNTFGWHREGFKMGVDKLAKAAGLSRQGALDGASAAETRGTFRRANPDTNKEAEWELVVALQPVDPSSQLMTDLQPVEGNPQTGRGLSGVKESIKKVKDNPPLDFKNMTVAEARKVPSLKLYVQATDYFPGSVVWEYVHNTITQNKLTFEKIQEAATEWSIRGFKPANVKGILEWAINGIPNGKTSTQTQNVDRPEYKKFTSQEGNYVANPYSKPRIAAN
jgi:hypothetical protein